MTVDELWKPAASLQMLQARAAMLGDIRHYFQASGVMEVETPQLSCHGTTDPAVESFSSRYSGPLLGIDKTLYLHTSPEFPMKRLLSAGSGAIYQICKVFRQGELGRFHSPEFTLLEWYRPGYDHHRLMDEVAILVDRLIPDIPSCRYSYQALFQEFLSIDPHNTNIAQLKGVAVDHGLSGAETMELSNADGWLDLLITHLIEPKLPKGLCFIYDFPVSQASLAQVREDSPPVAERFELYLDGIEVANGFHELTDAEEQERRFEAENLRRLHGGLDPMPIDGHLLQAMAHGLPACAGVALGLDRLLMFKTGAQSLQEVLAFPLDRA